MEVDATDVAGLYRRFAEVEARGSSPTYEALCLAVAEHTGVVAFLERLPRGKRQPNLLLGALRWLGIDVADAGSALARVSERPEEVADVMLARSTQTNEPARCAVLLPALALLPEPLALLEVGASAGLCLRYDAYAYAYRDSQRGAVHVGTRSADPDSGEAALTLPCTTTGSPPLPARVPRIAARLGLDANPLDPGDADVGRWLRCLVWPEHTERAERLDAALRSAAADPPRVVRGLAPQDVPTAAAQLRAAAPDATLVIVHSATVAYLDPGQRRAFAATCREVGAHRIGLEGAGPTADLGVPIPPGEHGGRFLLSVDDAVLGHADPHGRDLVWTAP
ncbi:DUF2332 domain-containing protein [Pseudactinotalea suaedae]|uniref:DUF2332 domain-containing protein n=1 Tax=Pseudactinotalea suaedae TaxID=1524924 RepID=UPI0012E2ADAE|nr:DUF2332 domain-containing protein [Pseudactinotalea suaedae]